MWQIAQDLTGANSSSELSLLSLSLYVLRDLHKRGRLSEFFIRRSKSWGHKFPSLLYITGDIQCSSYFNLLNFNRWYKLFREGYVKEEHPEDVPDIVLIVRNTRSSKVTWHCHPTGYVTRSAHTGRYVPSGRLKRARGVRRANVGDDFWECVKIATWLNVHVHEN